MTEGIDRIVDLGRARLNVRDEGAGPAVVLMHGWSYDLHLWDWLVGDLHAAGLRTVRYDQRGHGRSPVTKPYRIGDLVDDLHALVGTLGLDRPLLCGLSLGGFVAMEYAATHPDAVSGVVLADTCPHPIPHDREMADTIPTGAEGPQALADWWDADHPIGPDTDRERHARQRERFLANDADGLGQAIRASAERPDSTRRLSAITAPTLVVCGEHDRFFSPEVHRAMAAHIPGARCAVIPDAGHIACLDRPAAFNEIVGGFLSSVAAAPDHRHPHHQPTRSDTTHE